MYYGAVKVEVTWECFWCGRTETKTTLACNHDEPYLGERNDYPPHGWMSRDTPAIRDLCGADCKTEYKRAATVALAAATQRLADDVLSGFAATPKEGDLRYDAEVFHSTVRRLRDEARRCSGSR